MRYRFCIEFDDATVSDPKVAKNLRDHLKGAVAGRQQRRQLIAALEKSSTGDVGIENLTIIHDTR